MIECVCLLRTDHRYVIYGQIFPAVRPFSARNQFAGHTLVSASFAFNKKCEITTIEINQHFHTEINSIDLPDRMWCLIIFNVLISCWPWTMQTHDP